MVGRLRLERRTNGLKVFAYFLIKIVNHFPLVQNYTCKTLNSLDICHYSYIEYTIKLHSIFLIID